MKKIAGIALLAAFGLMAQPPGGRRGVMGLRSTVAGAPYSAVEVTVEQQALAGGNVIQRQNTRNVYRDGQGRVRTEATGATGRVTISDPVAGYVHELDAQSKTVTSRRAPGGGMGAMMRPRNNALPRPTAAGGTNVTSEDLGTQTINGMIAQGTRVTHTIPAGAIGNALPIQSVRETWVSADLKVPVLVKISDPRFGTRTTQLTQINRGEPDAALFQVPAGYTVRHTPMGGRGLGPGRRGQ